MTGREPAVSAAALTSSSTLATIKAGVYVPICVTSALTAIGQIAKARIQLVRRKSHASTALSALRATLRRAGG